MVVYPAVAAVYTWLCARRHFGRTLWLFAGSAAYLVVHSIFVPPQKAGFYAMHIGGAVFRTLEVYWAWSLRPAALHAPRWLSMAAVLLITAGLAAFACGKVRAGNRTPLFCLAWYLIVSSPLLLLTDHLSEYYVFLPVAGLCWLAGWAMAENWRRGVAFAAIYAALAVPNALSEEERNWRLTARVRDLVEGVAGAHERHPAQAILLEGVDTDLFWNAMLDRAFRLIGLHDVYLRPAANARSGVSGSRQSRAVCRAGVHGWRRDSARRTGGRRRAGSAAAQCYVDLHRARDLRLPTRVDAGSP